MSPRRVVVIGIGNPWRREDGAGWFAADLAGARLGPRVAVIHSDGEPARLLDQWADADLAILVDAVRTGAAPGCVHCLDAEDAVAHATSPSVGSHTLGVADAVRLGVAVGRLPRRLLVFGIEVADTSAGRGLGADVGRAVQSVAHLIEQAVGTAEDDGGRAARRAPRPT
jgi:hydrogenase maturation protease